MRYYLVGVKGTGMSALAVLLKDLGHTVIGSDVNTYYFTEDRLKEKAIPILIFSEDNIDGKDVYIIGNAFDETNVEVAKIIQNDYPYYYYHEFLGKNVDGEMIAISGTHGKTTTTSLLVQMLEENCNYIIGDGTGGGVKNAPLFILEACEYKDHFLAYHPAIAIINNIEMDHVDYFKTKQQLVQSFQNLADQSEILVCNGDDELCKKIKHPHALRFGFASNNDIVIEIIETTKTGHLIELNFSGIVDIAWVPFLGKHLIMDFVSAYLACIMVGYHPALLRDYTLPHRRMTAHPFGEAILIDDYAHHPTEIKCLYESLRQTYPDMPIYALFQPHTYTRTLKLKKQFVEALSRFDQVYVKDVFTSKRESYDIKKQKAVDHLFYDFIKYDEMVLKKIDKTKKAVWVFLGAGTMNDDLRTLFNSDDFS